MNEFELTITNERPVEAVWAYFQDLSKYPEGNPGMSDEGRARRAPGPMAVGGTLMFVGKPLGRSYESHTQCTAYLPQ